MLQRIRASKHDENTGNAFADGTANGGFDEVWNSSLCVHGVWMVNRPNENKMSSGSVEVILKVERTAVRRSLHRLVRPFHASEGVQFDIGESATRRSGALLTKSAME